MPDPTPTPPSSSPATEPELLRADTEMVVQPAYSWWSRVVPGARRREEQMARLQAGHQQVVGLVQSIRNNLELQVETQRRLLRGLDALPDAVEGLKQVGELTLQQKEMLGVIRTQLDQTAEQNKSMTGSLERFSHTMTSMESTTRTLASRAESSEVSLREMLERSERRLMLLNTVLIFLLVAGFGWLATRPGVSNADRSAISSSVPPPVSAKPVEPVVALKPVERALAVAPELTTAPVLPPDVVPVPPVQESPALPEPIATPIPLDQPKPMPAPVSPAVLPVEPIPTPPAEAPAVVAPIDPPPVLPPVKEPLPPTTPAPELAPTPQPDAPEQIPVPLTESPTQMRMREIREQMERLRREREAAETPKP